MEKFTWGEVLEEIVHNPLAWNILGLLVVLTGVLAWAGGCIKYNP